jgi:hypothetical protein
MLLVSVISYIDRQTLALLSPTRRFSPGSDASSIRMNSQVWPSASTEWIVVDRQLAVIAASLRAGMMMSVAAWTVASAAHALSSGFGSFAAARIALGCGEGATFPAAANRYPDTKWRSEGAGGGGLFRRIAWGYHHAADHYADRIALPARGVRIYRVIGASWLGLWWFVSRKIKKGRKPN